MAWKLDSLAKTGTGIALGAVAVLALAAPDSGLALPSLTSSDATPFGVFTPASVDPQLARRVSDNIRTNGMAARFTPAAAAAETKRTVTVAVRVDEDVARAISSRNAGFAAKTTPAVRDRLLSSTRYSLGIARGYQGFATKAAPAPTQAISKAGMPDLSRFEPSRGAEASKPSRFQPRLALESNEKMGSSPRTLDAASEQSVDLSGAYRITRNLNVRAGVRLSQDRDRLAPLSSDVQDNQAVYVGTQFRF